MKIQDEESYIKDHPIEGMFFAEFDITIGPKITYQYPERCIPIDSLLCKAVIHYIMPKPDLQQKMITVNTMGKKVIGCPVCIDDPKYERHKYIFNFGVILDNKHRSSPCIPFVSKLSSYMTELEKESYFVSNESTKNCIPIILKNIFNSLNKDGQSVTPINQSTSLYLKIFPPISSRAFDVCDYHVPVLLINKNYINMNDWDLTSQQIMPWIDGVCHVKKISNQADVDIELTRVCLHDMLMAGLVQFITVFQYSNYYITTAKLDQLLNNEVIQQECLTYVHKPGRKKPTVHDVITLYCGLKPSMKVKDLCSRYQQQIMKVNEQKLIQFGLLHHWIERIHLYPLFKNSTESRSDKNCEMLQIRQIPNQIQCLFNGRNHTDDICCKLQISTDELMKVIENDPEVFIVRK